MQLPIRMTSQFSNEIADAVISYTRSLPRGQPVTRSNGVKEWTVLAGIVSIHDGLVNRTPVCLSTGVKAMPDHLLGHFEGRVLHDSHAEVLCLRAFNLFVTKESKKVADGGQSEWVEKASDESQYAFKGKSQVQYAMYVSEIPCGDASLELLIDEKEEKWERMTTLEGGVLRGRESYTTKGKVRTKPGRRDSPITLSKSCSDKLCLKQFTGVLNSTVSQFVDPSEFYLNWLVLPEKSCDDGALKRCFKDRLKKDMLQSFVPFEVLKTSVNHEWQRSGTDTSPSNMSLVSLPEYHLTECITNGVKDGFYAKKTLVRPKGESCVSRIQILKSCQGMLNTDDVSTYIELKRRNEEYYQRKNNAYDALGCWCHTHIDDFLII